MFPVKLLEYVYLGLPVIAPRLEIIQRYFEEEMLLFYDPEDVNEMSLKILELYRDSGLGNKLADGSYRFFDRNNLEGKTMDYLAVLRTRLRVWFGTNNNHENS